MALIKMICDSHRVVNVYTTEEWSDYINRNHPHDDSDKDWVGQFVVAAQRLKENKVIDAWDMYWLNDEDASFRFFKLFEEA